MTPKYGHWRSCSCFDRLIGCSWWQKSRRRRDSLVLNGSLLDVRLSSFAEVNMAQKVSWTRRKSSWKGLHIMVGAKSIFKGCLARNHYFWGRRRSPNHLEIPLRLCRHGMATFSECRKGVGENLGGNRVANRVAQRNVHPPPLGRSQGPP